MKLFGSIRELVKVIFKEDGYDVGLDANTATTYTANREVLLPPGDQDSVLVGETNSQTLTNKTLTSPAITTPTGIVKGDVGLGNVDNTSDATKNAAAVTLTNKTIASPTVTGTLLLQNAAGSQPELHLSEDPDSGTNKTVIKSAATMAGDVTYTLPDALGAAGTVLTDAAGNGTLSWEAASSLSSPSDAQNYSLAASVAANALTISLKDSTGSDPSAGSPVKLAFRNATEGTGTYSTVSVTAAVVGETSIVVPSGATLGHESTRESSIYVYALNNAGTVELIVTSTKQDEGNVCTSSTIGTGSDSRTGIYSTTGRTGVAIRYLGRLKSTQTTAGTWATAPSQISSAPVQEYPRILAGTYTPTNPGSNINVDSISLYACTYTVIDNVVTVYGRVLIDGGGGNITASLSLPIATNLNSGNQLNGIVGGISGAGYGAVRPDETNDAAQLVITTSVTSSEDFRFSFQYLLLNAGI